MMATRGDCSFQPSKRRRLDDGGKSKNRHRSRHTALIAAIKKGDLNMVKNLLYSQADPSRRVHDKSTNEYQTPLSAAQSAPISRRVKITRMLLTIDRLWASINPKYGLGSRKNKPSKIDIEKALRDLKDELRNNDVDQFWRVFPYRYRKRGQCKCYYFEDDQYHTLKKLFRQGTQSKDIESDDLVHIERYHSYCGDEEDSDFEFIFDDGDDGLELKELLKDITLKQLRELTRGKEPSAQLRDLLENGQFGDAVDVEGFRGHGMFILGFGDLPMSKIKKAFENGTEREHLRLLKTFDHHTDDMCSIPMEVGDAPNDYYQQTSLRDYDYRWLDPSRTDYKGQIWKDCILDMDGCQQSGDYVYISWRGQADNEWTPKNTLRISNPDVYSKAGIAAYCTRYDEAVAMRKDRISQYIMDVWPLEGSDDICRLLVSFLIG